MKTVEFRFSLRLPEAFAEGLADLVLRWMRSDLKAPLRNLLRLTPGEEVCSQPFDLCAVIKPDEVSREWGACDKWITKS